MHLKPFENLLEILEKFLPEQQIPQPENKSPEKRPYVPVNS